jgi:Homeobox KN domain
VLPQVPQYAGQHRGHASDYSNGRGLPPLYAGPDPSGQGVPSPTRSNHHPSPYGSMAPQEYVGPYQRVPPSHGLASAGYGAGYDAMGDYGDAKQKRRRGNLPKAVTDILRQWFQDHLAHPYPTEEEKQTLMAQTGLTMSQVRTLIVVISGR